ncbi:MAG: SDR family NAD(P)-dependent oxidoreductase [Candidatus Bathyarchaeota archaeon]|jgi:dTDP-L-rhamnose 4-epimerase
MKDPSLEKILVTGGAGFIGSHTADLLINNGYDVTVVDNLEPQVHGKLQAKPDYINKDATFIQHDLQDQNFLKKMLSEVDAVIHLAALVGVGQSMYQIERYINGNTGATATLLDILAKEEHNIKKLVVASSMSVYGEGKYYCEECATEVYPNLRTHQQLKNQQWNQLCPSCGSIVKPLPTDENKPLMATSIYAQSKRHQEEMCLLVGETYGIPAVALRYFNVYGSRQSLSNPYTGACAIFTSRILNDKSPYIFEDGNQKRDLIHVTDIAQANLKALENSNANYEAINIGTGKAISIVELAETLIELYNKPNLKPHVSNEYRKGDIRHCYADTTKAQKLLNFKPATTLQEGLTELAGWAKTHGWDAVDLFEKALQELKAKRLAT